MLFRSGAVPFTFVKDNLRLGFDVELAQRFAASLGKRAVFSDMDFGALIAAGLLGVSAPAFSQDKKAAAGDAAEAHKKIAMCEGCHGIPGYKTAYPQTYHVPKLGGQSATYLANALTAYRSGQRNHPSMRGVAGSLTDKDIADIAAYYAGAKK